MPVQIAVLKETRPHERRVAMVPAVADKLAKLGAPIHLQSGVPCFCSMTRWTHSEYTRTGW